jgi:hypothetical protein
MNMLDIDKQLRRLKDLEAENEQLKLDQVKLRSETQAELQAELRAQTAEVNALLKEFEKQRKSRWL